MSTQAQPDFPPPLQESLNKGLLKRLPLTFQPFTRQQLREWDHLFPYERQSILHLLLYLSSLNESQLSTLFHEVSQLERKMGVRDWQFTTNEQTILNASLLARSPYYQEWRKAVQKVFDAAEDHAAGERPAGPELNRLIVLILPKPLPLDRSNIWQRWDGLGHPVRLDLSSTTGSRSFVELLLNSPASSEPVVLPLWQSITNRPNSSSSDTWLLDAGSHLVDVALNQNSPNAATFLSYQRLSTFRENFSREVNTMRKDLADADAVYDRLRKADVTPWCPAEVAHVPVIREFLRSLYLSGNGALIFGNSFVEWSASEAFRRARPSFVMAQFGVRSKPKPFTSVAVFENPDAINPLPSVDDLPGSSLDAQVLALYIWLAASRYDEYTRNTACLCIAEDLSEAYVIAPPEFPLWREPQPVSVERLHATLALWLSSSASARHGV